MSKVLTDVPAESSTAQETFKPMQERVDALQGKAHEHYWKTGDIDAAEALTKTADSDVAAASSAAPAETAQAVEPEAAPAPAEPKGEPQDEEPKDPKQRHNWRNLRTRAERAEAAAEELRRQLAETRKAAPGTQELPKAKQEPATADERPEFPDIESFQTEKDFKAAVKEWQKKDTAWIENRLNTGISSVESKRTVESETSTYQQREAEARTKYKDFDAVAYREDTPASLPMLRLLYTRKDGAELLYALGKDQAASKKIAELTDIAGEFKNFAELDAAANRDPRLARELGEKLALARVEFDRLAESLAKPAVPPVKLKPKVLPKPTSEVAVEANASAVEDELADAIKRGDQEAFNRISNKRALESARIGA